MTRGDPEVRRQFNGLVGDLDYPMFIVTARSRAGEPAGCLIGFASQCSIDPPRWLVCLSKSNRTYRLGRTARTLGVHFVPASADALAELFGGETGDEVDKFARVGWEDGPDGVPILDECRNCFAGRVLDRVDLGDHVGFVLEPIFVRAEVPQPEFTFHRARRIEAGHEA
ncbi:MAG TPA: flavin reductase family protein [Solirubrobacteraceae bacterium]